MPTEDSFERWQKLQDSQIELAKARAAGARSNAETVVRVPFLFSDASPKVIHVLKAGQLLDRAAVGITTAFDGAGAALQLGDVGSPNLIFATGEIDPTVAHDTFDNQGLFVDVVDQTLRLTITPGGGATAGAGVVLLKIKENVT